MMDIQDLKLGDIIMGDFDSGKTDKYLTYYTRDDNSITPVIRFSDSYYHIGMVGVPRFKPTRKATAEEKEWLKVCQKAEKFIPFSEIKAISQDFPLFCY